MPKLKSKKKEPKPREKSVAEVARDREVVYPEITADVCRGETAITAEDAKQLLGWEDVAEGGGNYVREIYSLAKIRVRLNNNVTNRPIYTAVVQTLKQEMLRRKWLLNGEPIIVGQTGLLLNGQHTLIALVLADREWQADKDRFAEYWPTPPVIEKVVVSGVNEDDTTVNTMDTCKPRSLADVLYRSDYFASLTPGERRRVAKMTEYAIRLMWLRTGAKYDAFAPRFTHAEALDFLARHPKLLDAVKHVHEEDGDEHQLARYTSPGYLAALMFLMGSSNTDPEEYRSSVHPDESSLDWSRWNDASSFVVLLAAGGKEVSAVRAVMAASIEQGNLSNAERWAILSNAWLAFSDKSPLTEKSLLLQYETDPDGNRHLIEQPSVGGIDLGDPEQGDEESMKMSDPTQESIEKTAKSLKTKAVDQLKKEEGPVKPKPKVAKFTKPSRASTRWAKGDVALIKEPDGETFLGQLVEDPWDCDDEQCRVTVQDAKGAQWEVLYADLCLTEPAKTTTAAKVKVEGKDISFQVGNNAWVYNKVGEHWKGKITGIDKNTVTLRVGQGFQGCGTSRTAWLKDLRQEQPT